MKTLSDKRISRKDECYSWYPETYVKGSIKRIKNILYKICDDRGVVTKSDIKWKFIEVFGDALSKEIVSEEKR